MLEASLVNVYGIDRFGEVSEKTEVMEAIEVPGLHGMKSKMGASMMMNKVEIGGKSFEDMFRATVYEKVGVSQYFEPLVMNQGLRGFLTTRGLECPSCTFIGASDGLSSIPKSNNQSSMVRGVSLAWIDVKGIDDAV